MSGANVAAAAAGRHQMAAALALGVDTLSENQTIQFTLYKRLVLPIDGSVFWVRASLVQPSAQPNAFGPNQVTPNDQGTAGTADTIMVKGSLHYANTAGQAEADANTVSNIIFTSEEEIEDFKAIAPDEMWLGAFRGLRFSFSRLGSFYEQTRIWHYEGIAVLATMESQIIDSPIDWTDAQVVSNSMPAWLAMREPIAPVVGLAGVGYPIFPSFLVPNNQPPPFIVVHCDPPGTVALQAHPRTDQDSNQWQLVQDRVRVTTVGLRHRQVLDFIAYVHAWAEFTGGMGITNMPVPRDLKLPQVELGALAQAKAIDFDVNYYQAQMRGVARQLILIAVATVDVIPVRPIFPARWNEFRWSDGATWV